MTGNESSDREIVCLCGSTKFEDAYKREQFRLTVEGAIVLTVAGCWKDDHRHNWDEIDDEDKKELDELHLDKIDLADRVHVLNVDGYIGESTRNEVDHAIETGTEVVVFERQREDGHRRSERQRTRKVTWLEPDRIPEPYDND